MPKLEMMKNKDAAIKAELVMLRMLRCLCRSMRPTNVLQENPMYTNSITIGS